VWGRNDPFFLPSGAEAVKRDNPTAVVTLLDTGHFALETHHTVIAAAIRDFLGRRRHRPSEVARAVVMCSENQYRRPVG
jgi:hypothetical protein